MPLASSRWSASFVQAAGSPAGERCRWTSSSRRPRVAPPSSPCTNNPRLDLLHLAGNRPWPWCLHQEELVGWPDRPLLDRIWMPVLVPKEPHDIPYLWLRLSASPQCCRVDGLTTEM
ncbi:hypothetical protein ZWY2020_006302 [Hordeum vulgare]|nr:hypothetical protein ZWY2020_006302 [Hordeum vulgare]